MWWLRFRRPVRAAADRADSDSQPPPVTSIKQQMVAVFTIVVVIVVLYFLYWFAQPLIQSFTNRPALEFVHEFEDPNTRQKERFPSVFDAATKYLSVIVPAYEEQARLPEMMTATLQYLLERQTREPAFTFEIILVDDGSGDNTVDVMHGYTRTHGTDVVRVLRLPQNQGKGGAVQQGMLHARGEYLLMVDADGATQFSDYDRLDRDIRAVQSAGGDAIAVGSRAHMQQNAVARRAWYRNVLMYGFHFAVAWVGGVTGVRDTQCGFKLFTRRTARLVFATQRLRRWCFDVELLHVAQRCGVPITEVDVNWAEIPGSKLALIDSSLKMARDLIIIRLSYMSGLWPIVRPAAANN